MKYVQLQFWLNNIDQLKANPINYVASCSKIVYSDASAHGFAGYVVDLDDAISHGQWAENETSRLGENLKQLN